MRFEEGRGLKENLKYSIGFFFRKFSVSSKKNTTIF